MFKHVNNSRKQGDVGLGIAIGYFASKGHCVLVPLTDNQEYDLVIDDGALKKVQVKTTRCQKENGNYEVALQTKGGNQSWSGVAKNFDHTKVDLLFVLTEAGDKYLFPSDVVPRTKITLCDKYESYKLGG